MTSEVYIRKQNYKEKKSEEDWKLEQRGLKQLFQKRRAGTGFQQSLSNEKASGAGQQPVQRASLPKRVTFLQLSSGAQVWLWKREMC